MPEPLYLDTNVGERAADLCAAAAIEIAGQARELTDDRCGTEAGWPGDCEEGRGWHRVLIDGKRSLHWLLERHAQDLHGFAERLRAADEVFGDAESQSADRYRRLG